MALSSSLGAVGLMRAKSSHMASILHGSHQHAFSPGGSCVCTSGQQKPLAAPYGGPYLVVSKGAKTFTIQMDQRQEIVSVDSVKGPHWPWSGVSKRGRLSRLNSKKGSSSNNQTSLKTRTGGGGGPCGGPFIVVLNIYSLYCMCLTN